MKNSILLYIGIGLIALGVFKPDLNAILKPIGPGPINNVGCLDNYVLTPPKDTAILEKCNLVVDILQTSNADNKRQDTLKLSSLYADIATLIRLNGDNVIVIDTQTLREVNSLCGQMLRLDIKDKYPNLAQAAKAVVTAAVGDDDITISEDSREKAAQAFDGLSWAFHEGGK